MNLIQEGKRATLVSDLFFTTDVTSIGILLILLLLHTYILQSSETSYYVSAYHAC